ncbi:hypothetical protein [Streptomyces sp. NBC_01187]|uniref:hypothetical protein n=1 Tax=Streptomyces sp. NBC_01187 TaxID=2903766 RepID=UPI0038672D96|nr:hypothetical protein OG220_11790 [Streptomyces sp. NBC_01187]
MKIPVDRTTLTAWADLLGLTTTQSNTVVRDIETTLRTGYAHRPPALRPLSFEQLSGDMDTDEFALMFLVGGLRQAGHPEAAHAVEVRGLVATFKAGHLKG